MNEPPLTDREIRILRGMLDEYDYAMRHKQRRWQHLRTGERMYLLAIAAVPAADLIARLTGH